MATSKRAKQIMAKQIGKLPNRTHNPGSGMPSMGTHRQPAGPIVGRGLEGHPFRNVKKYHQSKAFRQSLPVVGRGIHGHAFRNIQKYHQSKAYRQVVKSMKSVKGASTKGMTGIRSQRPR